MRAKRETPFTKDPQRTSLEESVRNMFWYTYNYECEADRPEDIDVMDAIAELRRKYDQTDIPLDYNIVREIIETINEFEHDCNRVRYFRHQELMGK